MADDDDDEGFGDFKFAPMTPVHIASSIANLKTRSSADLFSDDDWGDFVTTPSNQINGGFEFSNGVGVNSSIIPSQNQKPLDLFGNSVDSIESTLPRVESVPSGVELAKVQWVKPQGAIPLSLFGETEEEENNSGLGEPTVGDGAASFFHKKDDNAKKGLALNGGVGINDLIANLYSQSPRIKVENGSHPNSNSDGASTKYNESSMNVESLGSKTNAFYWQPNGFDSIFHDNDPNSNKLDSNIGSDFNSDGLSSDLVEHSESFDDDEDNDGGWEFKAADANKQVVEMSRPKVEEAMEKDPEFKVDDGGRLNVEESITAVEFSNDAHGHVDVATQFSDKPHKADDWNSLFDFNPSSASPNDLIWDSHSITEKNHMEIGSNLSTVGERGNSNENFWQFRDVFSEVGPEPKLEAAKVANPAPADLGGQTINGDGAHGTIDFFAVSEEALPKTGVWDFESTFTSSSAIEDGIIPNLHSSSMKNDTGNGACFSADDKNDESDDNDWEFQDAFPETVSKLEENEVKPKSHEALPLSIFGDEELENDSSQFPNDVLTHKPTSYPSYNSNKALGSNLSINDLISSLYIQAEENTSVSDTPKVSENGMPAALSPLESDILNHDDDSDDDDDDDAWEFKDAVLDTKDQNQTFATHVEDLPSKSYIKLQLRDSVEFYSKLKDDSCFVALSHFENLKKAQSSATPGEEASLEALGVEIEKIYDQLYQDNVISEFETENLSSKNVCFGELLKALQEPKFRVLESEYQLSKQLSLAETNLGSAIELSKHAASTLSILKLGSAEAQSSYISKWSKIVTVCAQELRHGAFIWKQALQKNVQSQIISKTQGRQYIICLAEIYRVVQVLGVSAELYKPWILLNSEEPVGLFPLLNECSTLWSTSGLDEALQIISQQYDSEFGETLKALLESMKCIDDLDALALQHHVFSGDQPICRLSMLTAGIMPGMKMVVWDGNHYLLKLANLWANLISSVPPVLPHLNVS
ncbi:uncharacterized protein LOC133790905 isoform X2 [Humulus lupulus]|uniref:uncharacterized protein LOC133790905 isoform X2 n=1 Tax=Humulus lupulus TaxID=3486 RepID=UPI002B415741|nr:uncharacterized protein LOC133790905 isoform X2 [Humulus lupulus]